jgi:hypothetical protein
VEATKNNHSKYLILTLVVYYAVRFVAELSQTTELCHPAATLMGRLGCHLQLLL